MKNIYSALLSLSDSYRVSQHRQELEAICKHFSYEMTDNIIELLKDFIDRDKFSIQAWNERGLNPSDSTLCENLKNGFNSTAELLIRSLKESDSKGRLKSILKKSITKCKTLELDTEEKEFAADLYYELASIIQVDIRFSLNVFLYGYFVVIFLKIIGFFNPERVIEEYKQQCTKCNQDLVLQVLQKKENIFNSTWIIGKCINCGEYNLFSQEPHIKKSRYHNYNPVEYLPKDNFTYDQALTRLEQVKYFRK